MYFKKRLFWSSFASFDPFSNVSYITDFFVHLLNPRSSKWEKIFCLPVCVCVTLQMLKHRMCDIEIQIYKTKWMDGWKKKNHQTNKNLKEKSWNDFLIEKNKSNGGKNWESGWRKTNTHEKYDAENGTNKCVTFFSPLFFSASHFCFRKMCRVFFVDKLLHTLFFCYICFYFFNNIDLLLF